jgi:hypothetical protein
MTANVIIAAVAAAAAGFLTRSYWGTPQMWRKILTALVGLGLGAYGVAWLVADGSC